MSQTKQIAKHLREVYFGGNWTSVNLKDSLADINWQQAITKVHNLNTIAALVFHINYYVSAVLKVLKGESLNASDKFSFDLPPVTSAEDWQKLSDKTFTEAALLATQIEKLDETKLYEDFDDAKYGSYYRNLLGIVEHTHYHLGQIVLIKKILNEPDH
ncbi:MAG TPA: DUF1572 domain-containing protein [Hanamia sp.]